MLHNSQDTNRANQPENGPRSLSEMTLSSTRTPTSIDPLIPAFETTISQLLARAANDPVAALQLRAIEEMEFMIERNPENGETLLRKGEYFQIPLNPESWLARLDPTEPAFAAANRHLNRLTAADEDAFNLIASKMDPMHPRCALTICIPVASEEKVETLAKTLANLCHQTCDKDLFDVVLLINDPYKPESRAEELEALDAAFARRCSPFFAEVDRARTRGLSVHTCAAPVLQSIASIGHIRSVLHSIAIERYRQRGPEFPDHLLMRADADMDFVEPTFIESLLRYSQDNPQTLNFFGRLRATPDALIEDPLLLFGYDLYHHLIDIRTDYGKTPCGGPHATTWLTAYVQSGGFDSWRSCGEDVILDEQIGSLATQNDTCIPFVYLGPETTIYTNTRRAEVAGVIGFPPAQQWRKEVAQFSATNPEVRIADPKNYGSFDEALSDPLLRLQIEDSLNLTLQVMFDERVYRKLSALKGIAENLSVRYGLKLSITPHTRPNRDGAIQYRLVTEALGSFAEWLCHERQALIAEQLRMQAVNPAYTPTQRVRAENLKYDIPRPALASL